MRQLVHMTRKRGYIVITVKRWALTITKNAGRKRDSRKIRAARKRRSEKNRTRENIVVSVARRIRTLMQTAGRERDPRKDSEQLYAIIVEQKGTRDLIVLS